MDIPEATAVLITGGGGFLGSHLIRELLRTQPQCTIYSASRNPDSHPDQQKDVKYLSCDISNKSQVTALFEKVKPHIIFHTTSPDPLAPLKSQLSVNVEGTINILQAAAACNSTRALVFTGSDSGIAPNQEPISEEQAVLYTSDNYSNPYGMTKGIAEALVINADCPELLTIVLRVPGLYGDYDYKNMLPALLTAIKEGQHKTQVGENTRVFEVLDVHKAAEAHVLAAKALLAQDAQLPDAKEVAGEAFYISDGIPTPYWDFFRKCYAAAEAPVQPNEIQKIPLGVAQAIASTSEWAYAVFTLGSKKPAMRRQNMDHFERGCNWKLDKAKTRLGYVPLTQEEQDAAIKRMMDWGHANLKV